MTAADASDENDAKATKDAHAADVSPAIDASLACVAETSPDASDVSESAFQCCIGVVESAVGDAGFFDTFDAGPVTNDPAALNCCSAIVARIDQEPDGGDFSADYNAGSSLFSWCCAALKTPMGPACTPWGPPMPPEGPEAVLAEVA